MRMCLGEGVRYAVGGPVQIGAQFRRDQGAGGGRLTQAAVGRPGRDRIRARPGCGSHATLRRAGV
jgi:hypothetical protein